MHCHPHEIRHASPLPLTKRTGNWVSTIVSRKCSQQTNLPFPFIDRGLPDWYIDWIQWARLHCMGVSCDSCVGVWCNQVLWRFGRFGYEENEVWVFGRIRSEMQFPQKVYFKDQPSSTCILVHWLMHKVVQINSTVSRGRGPLSRYAHIAYCTHTIRTAWAVLNI